jgi:hypothetical protein
MARISIGYRQTVGAAAKARIAISTIAFIFNPFLVASCSSISRASAVSLKVMERVGRACMTNECIAESQQRKTIIWNLARRCGEQIGCSGAAKNAATGGSAMSSRFEAKNATTGILGDSLGLSISMSAVCHVLAVHVQLRK